LYNRSTHGRLRLLMLGWPTVLFETCVRLIRLVYVSCCRQYTSTDVSLPSSFVL